MRNYFSKTEIVLWSVSVFIITISFCIFDQEGYLTLAASLISVTSLIFNAKGNPIGQALMIIFSLLYGIISFTFAYYGEMITYLGMTMPMAIFALISWLRHPYNGNNYDSFSSGVPSCGFDKNISLGVGGRTFAIACDACSCIQDLGNFRYFDVPKEDMEYIHSLFKKYGGYFPCI